MKSPYESHVVLLQNWRYKVHHSPPLLDSYILRQNDDTLLIQQTNTILSIAQEETQYRPIAYRMYLKTLAELKTGLKKRKRPKICQPPEQIVISSHAVKF